jgi:drug/metabolite transporter (DMT)-like permease
VRHYLAIFVTIVLYSTVEVVTKLLGPVPPHLLAFLRFFPAGVILLAIGAPGFRRLTRRDGLALACLGVVGVTATFSTYHTGLRLEHLDASTAAVIFSVNPVFTALAAVFFLGERLTAGRVAGVCLGLAGVYLVGFGFGLPVFSTAMGPLLMFAAQVTFSVYIAAGKKYVARYGPFFVTGFTFVVGSLCFLPMVSNWSFPDSAGAVWGVVYLCAGATGLGYVLYFYGLSGVPVAAGSSVFYVKPVLASALAVAVLGEELSLSFYLGVLIIFGSLSLAIFSGKGSSARKPAAGDG